MAQKRNKQRIIRKTIFIIGVFLLAFLGVFGIKSMQENDVEAANFSAFDPGYIISDYQMSNYSSMSEAEIQAFLNSKVRCDRGWDYYNYLVNRYPGYSWHYSNGHIVCLPEERFGDGETIGSGDTAAHIIWQAAQDYRINPKVLIVLLQKEQGLITDDYPNTRQYRSATGYGCPDTAPCSSQYYGFKNQIRRAAEMFRTVLNGGWTNYPVGTRYVQYNPDSSCGGSWVNIRNLATSALYRYTPYQPNSGALAAGYGTAYCGAYGNRNFYAYFEDWFGGITSEDEWAKCDPTIFCDMPADEYSAKAVKWMYNNGITQYYSHRGEFAPDVKVDGNQFSAFLNRYQQKFFDGNNNDIGEIIGSLGKEKTKTLTRSDAVHYLYLLSDIPVESEKEINDLPDDMTGRMAIDWAYRNNVTKYYSKPGEFAPYTNITRREVAIFLWRLAGEPDVDVKTVAGKFNDFPGDELGQKAIAWAYNNGITKYYSRLGEIAPYANITRREVAIFLWRLAGEPDVDVKTVAGKFNDFPGDELGQKAIAWAYNNGITKYYSRPGEIAPYANITRREVAIFLWRDNESPYAYSSNFYDLPSNKVVSNSIGWAYDKGITKYYTKIGEFAPDIQITRREAAIFLYRLYLLQTGSQ